LDKIPATTSETEMIRLLGAAPRKTIRLQEDSPRLEWAIHGKHGDLAIAISYFRGCIASITVTNAITNTYSKRNRFS
jgi:hypothetical protein